MRKLRLLTLSGICCKAEKRARTALGALSQKSPHIAGFLMPIPSALYTMWGANQLGSGGQ